MKNFRAEAAVVFVLCGLALSNTARAEDKPTGWRPVTFSKLVFRLSGSDEIGIASGEYRVFILEELRARGLNAVGAENLVFEKDDSHRAEFVLGGTVTELECHSARGVVQACRVGIDWQLLERRLDEVVYQVTTRAPAYNVHKRKPAAVANELILGALRSLIQKQKFRSAIWRRPARVSDNLFQAAKFARCQESERPFPQSAPAVLPATLMVELEQGFGSAFFINPEGLVLTAAHVVAGTEGKLAMNAEDGRKYSAQVVRVNKEADVALLRVVEPSGAKTPCLVLDLRPKQSGSEVYAVGAPASKQLAFSLTKGIVSGVRDIEGQALIQTDASVSPGNSGGPLLDTASRAVGVVSWKVASTLVEGVAFAVPVETALEKLGLVPDDTGTDASLLSARQEVAHRRAKSVRDTPDPLPSLDPAADAERHRLEAERAQEAKQQREQARRDAALAKITPGYIPAMRWGGVAVAAAGAIGAATTQIAFDPEKATRREYERLRLLNDISWIAVGLGGASFAVSYVLAPSLPEGADAAAQAAPLRVGLSAGGQVRLEGHF
ncbi:MAG: serine protease [Myxococcales bacterium]|nr:serine protease [Myxococcales bacterium]